MKEIKSFSMFLTKVNNRKCERFNRNSRQKAVFGMILSCSDTLCSFPFKSKRKK